MRFLKGHGTGNDFVILPDAPELTPELVAALCDRRRGIGGDGVLRVARSTLPGVDWFMDYWNADGSLAEMCGNGIRVFARYLESAGLAAGTVPIETRAGVMRAVIGEEISVDMGMPKVYGDSTARIGALELPGVAVDCGNPHLVCALPDSVPLSMLDLTVAPRYDHDFYPSGVNVEFYSPVRERLHARMRVYERGSAETLSCGTGACAVAAVVLRNAGLESGAVTVDVPGGRLTVTFDAGTCWLAGPVVMVATGDTTIEVPPQRG